MEPMSRVIVLDEQLPEALAVQRVEVRRISMQPGVAAGAHVHNGPVFPLGPGQEPAITTP
jgi:hypothetical protein